MLQALVLCPSAPAGWDLAGSSAGRMLQTPFPKSSILQQVFVWSLEVGEWCQHIPGSSSPHRKDSKCHPARDHQQKNPANFSLKLERLLCDPRLCSIPITAASPNWPPHGCHPQSSRTSWVGTVVAPGDTRSVAVPCASSTVHGPYLCPVLSAVEAEGGELERLGREVWEPCRNTGLGAGACQAQMGSLVVVKIIQPLLKTQAQQSDPTAPVVAIPTRVVFASPAITIHPWALGPQLPITGHMFPTPGPLCSVRIRGLSFLPPQGPAP